MVTLVQFITEYSNLLLSLKAACNALTLLLAYGRDRDCSTSAEPHTAVHSAKHGGFTGLLASSFSLHYTEVSDPHLCRKAGNFLAESLLTPPNSLPL